MRSIKSTEMENSIGQGTEIRVLAWYGEKRTEFPHLRTPVEKAWANLHALILLLNPVRDRASAPPSRVGCRCRR